MKTQINFSKLTVMIVAVMLTTISLVACQSEAYRNQSTIVNSLPGDTLPAVATSVANASFGDGANGAGAFVNDVAPEPDTQASPNDQRIILKNATLAITVEDPETRINEITAMAESMGGWVVMSNVFATTRADGEATTNGSITIRVPAERLSEMLERIKSDTISVNNENITGQDVTNEYVDLSSRLKNLEATEIQLQRIMETATEVEDVLAVQRELTTVRENIEVIQGRLTYFDEAAAYASVSINVQPKPLGPIQTQQVGWNPATTAERAMGSLVSILQGLADLTIALIIVVLPILIIIGIPVWLLWRSRRRFAIFQRPNLDKTSTQSEA